MPIIYYKDAARAANAISRAPADSLVKSVYLVDGLRPTPTAAQLAESVRSRLPAALIDFKLDPEIQAILDQAVRPIDDSRARTEWAWAPSYDLDTMIDDFLEELRSNPGTAPV